MACSHRSKLVLLGLLFCLMTGCTTKILYGWVDWVVEWQVEQYVDLTQTQQRSLSQGVKRVRAWHSEQELPKYIADLQDFSSQLQRGTLTGAQWLYWMDRFNHHGLTLMEAVLAELPALIAQLSDEQVDILIFSLEVEQGQLVDKYQNQSNDQRIKQSQQRFEKTLKPWIGSLTEPQSNVLTSYLSERSDTLTLWLDYRQEWLQWLVRGLVQRHNEAELKSILKHLLLQPQQLQPQIYQQQAESNRVALAATLSKIQSVLTDKQMKRLQSKLNGLIEDFSQLHSSGK